MGIDAVMLLRVRSLDLFRDRFEAAELRLACLTPLDDGAVLLATYQRFGRGDPRGLAMLANQIFGDDLSRIHDDPRGVLVFPDACEPRARTYDGVVAEVGNAGVWISSVPLDPQELRSRQTELVAEVQRLLEDPSAAVRTMTARLEAGARAMPAGPFDLGAIDPEELRALASQVRIPEALQRGDGLRAVVMVRPRAPLASPLAGANKVHVLNDGTHVIVTSSLAGEDGTLALQLGSEWASWVDGHHDARGVLVFGDAALDDALGCAGYDEVVTRIGERGRWIRPRTFAEHVAIRAAAAKSFLEGE